MPDDKSPENAPAPGTPEHDQAMVDKARASRDPANADNNRASDLPKPEKPEGGHDKFYDAETGAYNWEAHARELEYNASGRGQKPQDSQSTEATGRPQIAPNASQPGDAEDVIARAGLSMDTLSAEVRDNGDLSEASYEALEKQGVSRSLAKRYIELEAQAAANETKAAMDYIGGEDAANQLMSWAAQNIPADEIEKFNAQLAGPDWRMAVDALKQRQGAKSPLGREGQEVDASGGGPRVTGFESREQMKAAMADPRYGLFDKSKADPAYRREVAEKIAVSNFRQTQPVF